MLFYLCVACVAGLLRRSGRGGMRALLSYARRAVGALSKSKLSRRDAADALRGDAAMPGRAVDHSTGSSDGSLAACKTLGIPSKQVGRDALQQATSLVACKRCFSIDSRQREPRNRQ